MTAPQFATFVPPALDGDTFSPKDNLNKPLIVKVKERKEGIVTSNSPNGGPGMIVDLVDLTDNKVYRGVLWMGGPSVDGLTPLVGQVTLIKFIDKVGTTSGRHYASPESASEYAANAQAYYQQFGDPFAPTFAELTPATPAPVAPVAAPASVAAPAPVAQQAAAAVPPAAAPAGQPAFDPSQYTPEQLAALANLAALQQPSA